VVTQASRWLVSQQEADGRWRAMRDGELWKFSEYDDVGVTALSALALLPGASKQGPEIQVAVFKAMGWLRSIQADDGSFGTFRSASSVYGHALALRALCRVQQTWPHDAQAECLKRAAAYAVKIQNPVQAEVVVRGGQVTRSYHGSGWSYEIRMGDSHSHITAGMLRGLALARAQGIKVSGDTFESGLALLEGYTDEESGRTGFAQRGGPMSRVIPKKEAFPGTLSEQPTAAYWLARADLIPVHSPNDDTRGLHGDQAVDLVAELPPRWDVASGSIDFAYWAVGAEVMASVRRPSIAPAVTRWRSALEEALIPNRVVEGDRAHWPAVDAWSVPGMECYSTAAALMALQAFR